MHATGHVPQHISCEFDGFCQQRINLSRAFRGGGQSSPVGLLGFVHGALSYGCVLGAGQCLAGVL